MVDRLNDLGLTYSPVKVDDEHEKKMSKKHEKLHAEFTEHMKLYDPIKRLMDEITLGVREIEKLTEKDRYVTNDHERKVMMEHLETLMGETTKKGRQIKAMLDQIKVKNVEYKKQHGEGGKLDARLNVYNQRARRFHALMNEYNSASYEFKQGLHERARRQLKIADCELDDDQIERIVQSGNAQSVISETLLTENLQATIASIEERHNDILKLERQVLEVYELFKDLATLVDLQQEHLDVIESRVANAHSYVQSGEAELRKAEKWQNKARRKKCCMIIVLLTVIVVTMSSIIYGALAK